MSYSPKYIDAAALRGLTFTAIDRQGDGAIVFTTADGRRFEMSHAQDCCEFVRIHDVSGDLQALLGSPLVEAREETSQTWPDDVAAPAYVESYTWTSYFFSTATAKVRIRWLGESNGYYSESVELEEI